MLPQLWRLGCALDVCYLHSRLSYTPAWLVRHHSIASRRPQRPALLTPRPTRCSPAPFREPGTSHFNLRQPCRRPEQAPLLLRRRRPMEVTASGVPRTRRSQLAQLVERLRGTWSGALNVGLTAAVIVEGPQAELDWAAPKLVVALQHGIPVVSADWLLYSQAHGFLLSTERYRLEPPPPRRRSSAASTSAAAGAPRPTNTAATVNQADAAAAPPTQLERSAVPGSPAAVELEVLRGEAMQPRHSPLPPQRSQQAAAPTPTSKPLVAPDELLEALPSPAADIPLQHAGRDSPALPGSPLQLLGQAESELESGGHSAAVLSFFSPSSSSGDKSGFGGSPAWSAGSPGSPDSRVKTVGLSVTPAPPSAGTDSDTKIARFLSRRSVGSSWMGGIVQVATE